VGLAIVGGWVALKYKKSGLHCFLVFFTGASMTAYTDYLLQDAVVSAELLSWNAFAGGRRGGGSCRKEKGSHCGVACFKRAVGVAGVAREFYF